LFAEGRLSELDVPNLSDEIESMGKSQKRAIESYLLHGAVEPTKSISVDVFSYQSESKK
jgi:hypothetical protein